MIVINLVFYIMILHYTEAGFRGKGSTRTNNDEQQAMSNFANLLKTIVRVNEERVDAIRKIANLQDYMLTKNRLKIDDYYDSVETPDSQVVLALEDTPKIRRTDDDSNLNERCEELYNESKGQPTAELKQMCSVQAFHLCSLTCLQKFEETCYTLAYCTAATIDKVAKECMLNCKEIFERTDK